MLILAIELSFAIYSAMHATSVSNAQEIHYFFYLVQKRPSTAFARVDQNV
jgi:hypothetical protein